MNRARREGRRLFCSRRCFGLDRRVHRSRAEKRRRKAAYDAVYQKENRARRLVQKREYHARTYDPKLARKVRKARSRYHVAYCRQYYADPAKKAAKVEYDKWFRNGKRVGEYAECAILLNELWKEIRKQEPSWYERAKAKGFLIKLQEKKRDQDSRRAA